MPDAPKHLSQLGENPRHMVGAVTEPFEEEPSVGSSYEGSAPTETVSMDAPLVEELPEGGPYDEEQTEGRKELPFWLDMGITVLVTVFFMLCVRRFVLDAYKVPSGSMLETIQLGDMLFGEKVSYYVRGPRPGEIVTFADPSDPEITLIKRVIATEGQTVELVDGAVLVDGQMLDEPYVEGRPSNPIDHHAAFLDADVAYPYVVPEGCIWVMGDNRTNSLDSRYFGAVRVSTVSSHAVYIYWPPSDMGAL